MKTDFSSIVPAVNGPNQPFLRLILPDSITFLIIFSLNAESITIDLDSLEDDIIKSYDKLVYSGKLSGEIEKQKSKKITSALSIAEKYL